MICAEGQELLELTAYGPIGLAALAYTLQATAPENNRGQIEATHG